MSFVGPDLGVQPNKPSRKQTFWKWTATKHHYLHAFGHIDDDVTKHRFLSGLVSIKKYYQKTRMFLAPPHNTCNYFILVTNGVSRPASFVQPTEAHGRLDVSQSVSPRTGSELNPASPGIRQQLCCVIRIIASVTLTKTAESRSPTWPS